VSSITNLVVLLFCFFVVGSPRILNLNRVCSPIAIPPKSSVLQESAPLVKLSLTVGLNWGKPNATGTHFADIINFGCVIELKRYVP